MKISIILLLAVMALTGCTSKELIWPDVVYADDNQPADEDGVPVKLNGVINTGAETRGDGVFTGTLPDNDLSVSIYRADNSSSDVVSGYPSSYAASVIDGTFDTSGNIEMSPTQYYLPGSPVRSTKFIAVYPGGGTYNAASRTVELAVDGTTDILATNVVQGSKSSAASSMTFNHLLAQVVVQVVAGGNNPADASVAWGKITGITISAKAGTATVTLPAPNSTSTAPAIALKASAPAPSAMTVKATHNDLPGGMTIPTAVDVSNPYGYALIVPSTNTDKLMFHVTTEKSGTAAQPVETIANIKYLAGTTHVITLTFSAGDAIDASVSLTGNGAIGPWDGTGTTSSGTLQ
jgi:hypothetical protein